MKSDVKRLFLLGGRDLEMEEIRKLLVENGCQKYGQGSEGDCFYADRELKWGAKLSDYEDLLDFDGKIYGIELKKPSEDFKAPDNYRAIDHHNSSWCLPSALEQVAELLGVELTRWQRLIAANDRGHIAALKAIDATAEEIKQIREADMKAQGVTEEELKKAPKELAKAEKNSSGIWLLETDFEHFSPLSDLLYEQEKLPAIIYNPARKSLTYYGNGVLKLVEKFRKILKDRDEKKEQPKFDEQVYYGGNPPGYFGLTPEYFKDHTMEETLETISQTLQDDTIYSYHIFMLPFTLKAENSESPTPEPKTSPSSPWKERIFELKGEDTARNYSEYTYFYNYVRKVLYNEEKEEDETAISRYFEHIEGENGYYKITVSGRTYCLKLDGIALRHFKNGVGILSFHLKNDTYELFDDILKINDFGRRIYPQYLGDNLVETTKKNLLACELALHFGGDIMREDFKKYEDPQTIAEPPVHQLPEFVTELLKEAYGVTTLLEEADGEKISFNPIVDDRMYVICHYLNDCISEKLTDYDEKKNSYAYESSQDWHRFVFVDGGDSTCQNRHMLKDLLAKATYPRWSDYSTLFGVTRYSLMLLTKNDWFAQNILNLHIRTLYYQMATLLLAYRAMILEFSDRVSGILKEKKDNERKKRAEALFEEYLEFVNRIYFKEITAQEQGIELFDMARSQMRLDDFLKELDHDIAELHDFIQLKIEDARNEQAMTLNKIAAIFLPPSLIAGLYGMNIIPFDHFNTDWQRYAIIFLFVSSLGGLLIVSIKSIKKGLLQSIGVIVLFFFMAVMLWCYPKTDKHTACSQTSPITKDTNATKK